MVSRRLWPLNGSGTLIMRLGIQRIADPNGNSRNGESESRLSTRRSNVKSNPTFRARGKIDGWVKIKEKSRKCHSDHDNDIKEIKTLSRLKPELNVSKSAIAGGEKTKRVKMSRYFTDNVYLHKWRLT